MKYLNVKKENRVLVVELARPEVRNAFDPEMIQSLTQVFSAIEEDVCLVRLSGQGESFCAGADLNWMKSMAQYSEEQNSRDSEELFDMFDAIWNCPVPVLTYAHGHVFGGAVGLLAVSDVVALESATMHAFSEVKIGLVPAVISHFVMQKIHPGYAHQMMLSGQRFGAEDSVKMGLATASGSQHQCEEHLDLVQKNILQSGPQAVRATKKLMRDLKSSSNPRSLTASVIAGARISAEGQEGLTSFFEKRKPQWLEG